MIARRGFHAFTMIEMVMSMLIISIVVLAIGSTMKLMGKTIKLNTASPTTSPTAARAAIDQIVDDYRMATAVTESTTNSITMMVPDRNSDGSSEKIKYAWSGIAGSAITVSYNDGPAIKVVDNVNNFSLQHLTRTTGLAVTPTPVESSEALLASFTTAPTINFSLGNKDSTCQYINPSDQMPSNATSWKITKLRVVFSKPVSTSTGNVIVSVFESDATQQPIGTALASVTLNLATAQTYNDWMTVTLPAPISGLTPGQGIVVTMRTNTASVNANVGVNAAVSPALTLSSYSTSDDGQKSWSAPSSTSSTLYQLYGTITKQP